MVMRKIVFFGNCYASTLEGVFSASLGPLTGDTASFVSCYDDSNKAESERRIAEADVVVAQVFDAGQKFSLDVDATSAKILYFPTVSISSLWPYGGVSHTKNTALPYWQCGPYDYLMGDNYLNRLINEGASPEDAVRSYLNLDIGKVAHLDRLHEIVMDRQRARDEKSDMYFADEMEQHFHSEHIFLNHYRPNVRMASSLARKVYGRLGVDTSATERVIARWTKTPFERTALPIHPGVAKHFGLAYGHSDYRYLYHTGEMLTFEEFATRYAAFQWNDALLQGVATDNWPGAQTFIEFSGSVPPERVQTAISSVQEGLARSTGSSVGERALAMLLVRQGEPEAARAALERAVRFDPADAASHEQLARLHDQQGRSDEAELVYRAAIASDPSVDTAYGALSNLLSRQNRNEEAATLLEVAVQIRPANGYYVYDLGQHYVQAGRLSEAEASFRRAMTLLPDHPLPRIKLAALLVDRGELNEVDVLLRRAEELASGNVGLIEEIGRLKDRLQVAKELAAKLPKHEERKLV